MFDSQIANAPWPGTGVVYNPPVRHWSFDTNFLNPAKLPPLTPGLFQTPAPVSDLQAGPTNGAIILSWSTHPRATYTLQYSSSLTAGNWLTLTSFVASANSATVSDPATNGQRFYQVVVTAWRAFEFY